MSNCFGFGNLRALRELILHAFIAITVQFLTKNGIFSSLRYWSALSPQ